MDQALAATYTIRREMRITLAISSLAGGGAERVATNMANYWASKGWSISILTDSQRARPPAYDLHPRVVHRDLAFSQEPGRHLPDRETVIALGDLFTSAVRPERDVLLSELDLVARLRHAIKGMRPDAVISFLDLTNVRVLLATTGLDVPVVVSEHSDPNHNNIGPGMGLLRRRLYPRAKYVVALTDESMRFFSGMSGVRCRIIPNPILPHISGAQEPGNEKEGMVLMSMGRLSHEKGFDHLLRAFAAVSGDHPGWSLEVWGEGPLLKWLDELASELRVLDRVRFPGFTRTPHLAMSRADLFALSSRCEGFSNVLCEAMAAGLPVVSFDCPSGPRYIIRDGVDGILVPAQNTLALGEALSRLMGDEHERKRLAARAPEIVDRFAIHKIMDMWEEILLEHPSGT
jgi:glycosyltransferase involved in cell wall biosynthesis